jgi:hypothetical protein
MKILSIAFLALVACGSENKQQTDAAVIHEGDASVDAPQAPDCFSGDPMTHDQIINACPAPGVTRIMKMPNLPLLLPDGSLPPLP